MDKWKKQHVHVHDLSANLIVLKNNNFFNKIMIYILLYWWEFCCLIEDTTVDIMMRAPGRLQVCFHCKVKAMK